MSFSFSDFNRQATQPSLIGQYNRQRESASGLREQLDAAQQNNRMGARLIPEPGSENIYGPAAPNQPALSTFTQPTFDARGTGAAQPAQPAVNPFIARAAELGFSDFAGQRNQAAALRG